MKNIKEILFGVVLIGIIVIGIYFTVNRDAVSEESTETLTVLETGIDNYKGKTTAIIVAATFCPACQEKMPEIESKIFDKNIEDLNLIINVIDGGDGKDFDTNIKQVLNPDLDFTKLTGEECGYVPSWVVMDQDWEVVEFDCGNNKGTDGLIEAIKKTGIEF